ncbi:unnamed protein product [Mesocestoides corti]|nr:unnamed protein product [Mesocestoides corti]
MANSIGRIKFALTEMLVSHATELNSQFRVTYSTVLNNTNLGDLQWPPQELVNRSFLFASGDPYKRGFEKEEKFLRENIDFTTVFKPPSQPLIVSTVVSETAVPNVVTGNSDTAIPTSFTHVRCPAHPLDSNASALAPCIGEVARYYQDCYRWRQLSEECAVAAAKQPKRILRKVFAPGRLVLLQLSTDDVREASRYLYGGRLDAVAGSKCLPKWVTMGVVLNMCSSTLEVDCQKRFTPSDVKLTVLTWRLPPSPMADRTDAICGTQKAKSEEEETILEFWETRYNPRQTLRHHQLPIYDSMTRRKRAFTPFPPQMMPAYCPESENDSRRRLVYVTHVPLMAVLAVFGDRVKGSRRGSFVRNVVRESKYLRESVGATMNEEVEVGEDDEVNEAEDLPHVTAVNKALFECAQRRLSGEVVILPLWQCLGLQGPEVEEWMTLTKKLSGPLSSSSKLVATPQCRDPIGHLNLVHRNLRRLAAIECISGELESRRDKVLTQYGARVAVLEELGFLDTTSTRPRCLTRKGVAACEIQQVGVLVCEMLFTGSLKHQPPADLAALLSCFVRDSKVKVAPPPPVPDHLKPAVQEMQETLNRILRVQEKHGIWDEVLDADVSPNLVGATYAWACGQPFSVIVRMTGVAEGHLLRAFQRLAELLNQVVRACRRLGDEALASRVIDAHLAINRDMVRMPSLYVADEIP